MFNVAKGAALMAGVEYDIKLNNGLYEILTNETGAKVLQKNMNPLGQLFTPRGNSLWQQTHARKRYGRKRY
jgi:metal-dependent amidase/aminoacylase/carboxypeptidase family protein